MVGMQSSLESAGPVGSAAPSHLSAFLVLAVGALVVDPLHSACMRLVRTGSSPASRIGDRALGGPGEQVKGVRMKIAAMQVFLSGIRVDTAE